MRILLFVILIAVTTGLKAQSVFTANGSKCLNSQLYDGFLKSFNKTAPALPQKPNEASTWMQHFQKLNESEKFLREFNPNNLNLSSIDTVYVGDVPNDTLVITGNYTHAGPIFVFNDGVLIFDNATVVDSGDIYVFQNGQMFADSTSFTFPQEYFYQRSLFAVNNGSIHVTNSSFNYSGWSHNLFLAQNATVYFENIHQNDWTTCGVNGNSSITIKNCNITGEYILTDTSSSTFINADTLILWHHFQNGSIIDFDFPPGDTVYNYTFNENVIGVDGVDYNLTVDSCSNVMWALMPENNTDVTITDSELRLIGCWFTGSDTVDVQGIYNNSTYTNYITPLNDRNLHLLNTNVQTWSMYVFDSSHIEIDSCQLGEVGSQQGASVIGNNFILDGSGGYYWVTDSGYNISSNVIVYTTVRSEKSAEFALGYSWLPFATASAISNSLLVSVQNLLPSDPIAYDNANVWLEAIETSDTFYVNQNAPILGSCWIDEGPGGGKYFFDHYDLSYYKNGNPSWTTIASNQTSEVRHNILGTWNTTGLTPDLYIFKLTGFNTVGDSVECFRPVTVLLSNEVGENVNKNTRIFPNPSKGEFFIQLNDYVEGMVHIYNILGEEVFARNIQSDAQNAINLHVTLESGIYQVALDDVNRLQFRLVLVD